MGKPGFPISQLRCDGPEGKLETLDIPRNGGVHSKRFHRVRIGPRQGMRKPIVSTPAPESALEEVRSPRRRLRRRRSRGVEWFVVLLALIALGALAGVIGLLLAEREMARRIYPNISVRGVPVGGMTLDGAYGAVERHYGAFLYNPVVLTYGERTWRPGADELGLRLVIDAALNEAFAYARNDTRLNNLRTALAVWEQGVDLPLRLEVDQRAMQRYLARIAAELETPPQDAAVALDGARVVVTPEQWGVQVLVDETLRDITAAVQGLERTTVAVRTRALEPRLRDARVAPVADSLQLMLNGPLVLEGATGSCAAGCRWSLAPERLAEWISVRRVSGADGAPTYTVSVDQARIRAALLPMAAALRQEGSLPTVAWNDGNLRIVTPGDPGLGLDADESLAAVNVALNGGPRQISLPMEPIPPPVTERNLASLGITERLGLGVSSFARSEQYRITNIRAGARRMNGVLIPPGATFSFNQQLGPVNAANGFVEGLAIVENRTQKEWGGGLCQVSTTVFRAAFFSGLPITERHEHAFRIGWYEELGEPPGLDAAIFTPYNDVRFVNDTGGWLLMESYVDLARQRLSVALYGPPTGRSVTYTHRVLEQTPAPTTPVYVNDPSKPRGYLRRTDIARGGIKVVIERTVTANGQVVARDRFPTEFKPWPNIYVRGTGR